MSTNIKATIPTYEELTDTDGKIYTVCNASYGVAKFSIVLLVYMYVFLLIILYYADDNSFPTAAVL
jgi:hypothetical protein